MFFCNSGAEANEAAFKVARKFGGRGRHVVVSAFGSFHGRTLAALAATGQPTKHEPFQPMPEGFRHVPYGDLDALAAAIDPSVTAVLIEPVQGEGGVVPAPPGYLEGIRALCDERGLLMIVDEVQTGFARTGRWFGFEHAGVRPDVVCLAKAMGNGMPIGACWARREVAAVLQPGDHGSTYSGTPIATAAARATIAEMRRIDAPALALLAGARLQRLLLSTPGVTDGPRRGSPPGGRARRSGHQGGGRGVPRAGLGGEQRDADRAALRAAAHRERRRDRRGRGHREGGAGVSRDEAAPRHLLDVTDLDADELQVRAGAGRAAGRRRSAARSPARARR